MNDMRICLIIFAKNEQHSLEKTVRDLQEACSPQSVAGMVVFLAPNATEACSATAQALAQELFGIPVQVVVQQPSGVGLSMQTLFSNANFTHVMILSADYFVRPTAVAQLIAHAAQQPDVIYKFSRALPGGSFSSEYSRTKILLYRVFVFCLRILYHCNITDPAFISVLMPCPYMFCVRPRERSVHAGLEWLLIMLRCRVPVVELAAQNLPRTEQKGSSTVIGRLNYIRIALRVRFAPKKKICRERVCHAKK